MDTHNHRGESDVKAKIYHNGKRDIPVWEYKKEDGGTGFFFRKERNVGEPSKYLRNVRVVPVLTDRSATYASL